MSPRDDKVWRLVVDDARVRPHEVRQVETARPDPLCAGRITGLAKKASEAGSEPQRRHRRLTVAVPVVLLALCCAAWMSATVFWPTKPPANHAEDYGSALAKLSGALPSDVDRLTLARILKDQCVRAARVLRELSSSEHVEVAGRAREVNTRLLEETMNARLAPPSFASIRTSITMEAAIAAAADDAPTLQLDALDALERWALEGIRAMADVANDVASGTARSNPLNKVRSELREKPQSTSMDAPAPSGPEK
jgi:hypothetical protein